MNSTSLQLQLHCCCCWWSGGGGGAPIANVTDDVKHLQQVWLSAIFSQQCARHQRAA
jgi:hypothetical protein